MLATFVAGVEHTAGLYQQQFDLTFRIRLVLDALRHDEHLACRDVDGTIPKIDSQIAFKDNKRLVRFLMIVPNEIARSFTTLN